MPNESQLSDMDARIQRALAHPKRTEVAEASFSDTEETLEQRT